MTRHIAYPVFIATIFLSTVVCHAAGPAVTFTYPYGTKTTALERIRYAGHTDPMANLSINGIPQRLSSIGSFAGLFPLSIGKNVLVATAELGGVTASARIEITRKSPSVPFSDKPWRIDPRLCLPRSPVWLSPPGSLTVRCVGSPGGTATFSVGPFSECPMIETGAGIYEGELVISSGESWNEGTVEFELIDPTGKKKTRGNAQGSVTLLTTRSPIVLETSGDDPIPLFRTSNGRTRYVDLPAGVLLEAVGREEKRYEVRLSSIRTAFVDTRHVKRLPEGTQRPRSTVESIRTEVKSDRTVVHVPLSKRLPFIVTELDDPPRLDLRIYGAQADTWWITGRHNDRTVKRFSEETASDGAYRLVLTLKHNHWGYLAHYEGTTLCLDVNAPPSLPEIAEGRLRGLVVAIDPGHGGTNRGSRAPGGTWEKDVNRKLGDRLEKRLRAMGAETVILRQGDETISLQDRVERARRSGANILVSLHNNSIGDDADPLATRGASTYHYYLHSVELSRIVYEKLLALPEVEPWGHVGRFDFAPIRGSTDMVGFLVECLFLSHPMDEEIILNSDAQNRITEAIAEGVLEFLQERLSPQI
ncbi:MAG: N-acetylmuramoyl-L-alanine amidase [bacterium]